MSRKHRNIRSHPKPIRRLEPSFRYKMDKIPDWMEKLIREKSVIACMTSAFREGAPGSEKTDYLVIMQSVSRSGMTQIAEHGDYIVLHSDQTLDVYTRQEYAIYTSH